MEDDNFFDDADAEAQTAIATKAADCNRSKRRIGVLRVAAILTLRFQIALPLGLDPGFDDIVAVADPMKVIPLLALAAQGTVNAQADRPMQIVRACISFLMVDF